MADMAQAIPVNLPASLTSSDQCTIVGEEKAARISYTDMVMKLSVTPSSLPRSAKEFDLSLLSVVNKKPVRRPAAIYGKALDKTSLAAEGVRRADVFISRLRPDTTDSSVLDLIKGRFPVCTAVKVKKLVTKYDS